jgi:hypothetical protein
MKAITNPIALAALNRAINAGRIAPTQRPKYSSRIADKFVVRGYVELFAELGAIGSHQGRSMNSEVVAAVLDALAGQKRSMALLNILKDRLGEQVAKSVLDAVPDFELANCVTPKKFVVRYPPDVRETIKDGVDRATRADGDGDTPSWPSMNSWMLDAMINWVNIQRQLYSLLSAAIAVDQTLLPHNPD